MIAQDAVLVQLVRLVDRIPEPPGPPRGRGRPPLYAEKLFLKALLIMIVRRLHRVHELLSVLQEPTAEMGLLRSLLAPGERFPSRRTFERRLGRLPERLPAQIACLGTHLVSVLQPWAECGRAVAIDSTVLWAYRAAVWHKKHQQEGRVPHRSIDTEAGWTKSDWHGWVYGWKLHLVTTVARVWIPLSARLTPANVGDNMLAPELIQELPSEVRFVLGDLFYNAPQVRQACEEPQRFLVTTQRGAYPHADEGVEVRRLFHQLRSVSIENFNEHFKSIFDVHGPVPTKGQRATARFALGAVFVYQVALLYRHQQGLDLNSGLKAFLRAA